MGYRLHLRRAGLLAFALQVGRSRQYLADRRTLELDGVRPRGSPLFHTSFAFGLTGPVYHDRNSDRVQRRVKL